jgi:LPXTG-motif cell wall-anchored protein
MKKSLFFILYSLFFCVAAHAGNTIYYSPTCPHCHHAMEFFDAEKIEIEKINVTERRNLDAFRNAVQKCELTSGGVPLIVIGEKCFQGYAEFMNQDILTAITGDASVATDTDLQKKTDDTGNPMYFYLGLVAVILGLGILLFRKKK